MASDLQMLLVGRSLDGQWWAFGAMAATICAALGGRPWGGAALHEGLCNRATPRVVGDHSWVIGYTSCIQ